MLQIPDAVEVIPIELCGPVMFSVVAILAKKDEIILVVVNIPIFSCVQKTRKVRLV